jgi:outer membrane immunogenic protein
LRGDSEISVECKWNFLQPDDFGAVWRQRHRLVTVSWLKLHIDVVRRWDLGGSNMKKILLAMAAAVILTAPAKAANMPVKAAPPPAAVEAVYNWTGLYIGVNGGWARGDADWVFLSGPGLLHDHRIDGWLFGGHAGFLAQFGRFVLGAEVNGLAARIDGSAIINFNPAFRGAANVDRLFTVGPRGGIAFNNVLVYGTGGFASARIETEAIFATGAAAGQTFWTGRAQHHGWFAGGGIEYGFTPNLIVGVEATHVRLRNREHVPVTPAGAPVPGDRHDVEAQFTTIRGRVTYKFGPWGGPVVARY